MDNVFITIDETNIQSMNNKFYSCGKEIKIGDKIIPGMTINYSNIYGIQPERLSELEASSMSLHFFVLPKNETFIYQLYNKK